VARNRAARVAGLVLAIASACSAPPDSGVAPAEAPGAGPEATPAVRFVDVTAESGIDQVLPSGTDSTYPMPAVVGGGIG